MADVVILGGGVAGHTAALHLSRWLGNEHTVTVVTPNARWNWIPSNIWVGVGRMTPRQVTFPLAPVYAKRGIAYKQAKAVAIRPDGDAEDGRGAVDIVYTGQGKDGQEERIRFDFLVNATGPRLNFGATPGLGPDEGYTVSVCTADHAVHAAKVLAEKIEALKADVPQTLVIGTGHGTATCQGAAFEYLFNVDHELRDAGVRGRCRLVYLSNEAALGDFGMGGMVFEPTKGKLVTSQEWAESLYRERGIDAIVGAHVNRIEEGLIHYETLDGTTHALGYDFAMLIPPFAGQPMKAYARDGADITGEIFAPNGLMKVDGDYTPKPYEDWKPADWPQTYAVPGHDNIFAAGIAFAPPHQISRPRKSPNGTVITPAPPRTGMPSGVIAKTVAMSIRDRIEKGPAAPLSSAPMYKMGAACVASAGADLRTGSAALISVMPVVPDPLTYPTGRDTGDTRGEIGLSGHWMKLLLHHLFLHKAKGRPGWHLIPE
ncbi:sulfide-quinone oxidoreductase [Raineyella antarctica]|uniref:Sulfide-quinone oxidoreductase n=1 Tax=Raineyella antarctica TaxID=1577474 RepID=A0A1G6HH84_9ACTN|nr:FAD/NAD(P)-binding oxidoreductase [Raineyella antarctica]SDB93609.1 sulfide-quinone oxidoreductase [Raineyella antarctica]